MARRCSRAILDRGGTISQTGPYRCMLISGKRNHFHLYDIADSPCIRSWDLFSLGAQATARRGLPCRRRHLAARLLAEGLGSGVPKRAVRTMAAIAVVRATGIPARTCGGWKGIAAP